MKSLDPVELFARLDPLSPARLDDLVLASQGQTLSRIAGRRSASPARARRIARRRLAPAAVAVIALAIPALAFSGVAGSLFGFSNQGSPVGAGSLSRVGALLEVTGAKPGSFVQLGARAGWAVYAARTSSGNFCFFDGPAGRNTLGEVGGGCVNGVASAGFPSPSMPVWDMSLFEVTPPAGVQGAAVERLAGVAADGVSTVQILASDCHVVATVPVIENVYIDRDPPVTPDAFIVARDTGGHVVWREAVPPVPPAGSCGLG